MNAILKFIHGVATKGKSDKWDLNGTKKFSGNAESKCKKRWEIHTLRMHSAYIDIKWWYRITRLAYFSPDDPLVYMQHASKA